VTAAGALVGDVAGLRKALVDLLVVLVSEVLGLIHEATHVCLLSTVMRSHVACWRASHIPDTGPNKVRTGMEV
jgi:hypothetical protein